MTKFKLLTGIIAVIALTSCETLDFSNLQNFNSSGGLTTGKIVAGLKEALDSGTEDAVKQLSKDGGFAKNNSFRIGMPKELQNVTDTMKSIGLGFMLESFEKKMNEAAERASISAGPVFLAAIKQMKFNDAKEILYGSDTAATAYLKKTTSKKLIQLYKPIVGKSMKDVGAVKFYNELISKYDAIPFKSKPKFSLDDYITDKALNAMFSLLADEEKKIRKDPAARTTQLLQEVFR
jgi:uncharacterized protein DUF4197